MTQNPPISPDGAYWWDGQAWQPMPPGGYAPRPEPAPQEDRPSWLPAGAELPGTLSPAAPVPDAGISVAEPPAAPSPAPAWAVPAPPAGQANRTVIMVAVIGAIAVLIGATGLWALHQATNQPAATSGNPVSAVAPTATSTPSAAPSPVLPLTARLSGDYCPVAHPGDSACWKGSFVNTGPPVGKLAMIFITSGPDADWFAHHANGTLSGFYTTAGCDVDPAHSEIVCGAVPSGASVDVYLGGDVTTRGTFNYAVKFADISSGTPVYVDQHSDGTHDVVSWTEVIT